MAESEARAEDWARDMVVGELQRAYPDGILPSDLQDRLAIGTADLRTTLDALRADGTIRGNSSGEVALNRNEEHDERTAPAVESPPTALAQELHAADETPEGDDAQEQPVAEAQATGKEDVEDDETETPDYTVSLLVSVEFPLPRGPFDGNPPDDEVAVKVAEALRDRVRNGLAQITPDGDVRVELVALEQLVRRQVDL
jgi:hypothetical protein